MTNQEAEQILKDYELKNETYAFSNVPKSTKQIIRDMLIFHDQEMMKKLVERLPEETPFYARICQNRNGLDYCGTCEQSWENCSCSARNTGFNKCLSQVKKLIQEVYGEKDL